MITIHPAPQELTLPGMSAIFTVTATGNELKYLWLKDGVCVSETFNNTLDIESVTESDEGQYSCIVSNDAGCATSTAASLTLCKYMYNGYILASAMLHALLIR